MATYNGFTRTNYFSVTDEDMLRDIVDRIVWDNDDGFFEDRGGKFAFGSYGSICGLRKAESENDSDSDEAYDDDCDDECEADAVYEALQSIMAPDDAIIITEIGYEKLRYLVGYAVVITSKAIETVELRTDAVNTARKLLNNPTFNPAMEY